MIAVEEKNLQSVKTGAALYNGQPTDTGAKCHSVGVTSGMPSIQKNMDGVSVENVHKPNKQWFVLRVSYDQVFKAKVIINAHNIECYVPMRYKQITKHGKKHIATEPLLPSLIFVHSSMEKVDALLRDDKVNSIESRPFLSFYFDHTSYRQDNPDRNPPLVIRDEAMQNFINLTFAKNPHIIPVTSQNILYELGDEVIITDGDFKGIKGRVARIAGQQQVIVELFSGCLLAMAYILKEAMEIIGE